MRENIDSQSENGDLKPKRAYKTMDESLFETIQFTEEELRKIRQPNSQPLDGDYFEGHSNLKPEISKHQSEIKTSTNNEKVEVSEIDEIEFEEIKGPPAPSPKRIIAAPEDSEFHYKSPITAKIEQEIEREKELEDVEYWDDYERAEMEFWEQSDSTDLSTKQSDEIFNDEKSERMTRTAKEVKRPIWKTKQKLSERNLEVKGRLFKKVTSDVSPENIPSKTQGLSDAKEQPQTKLVDRVMSMINGKDAVELNEFIQEPVQNKKSVSKSHTQETPDLIKHEKNLFSRAKSALDSHLTRSVEKGLAVTSEEVEVDSTEALLAKETIETVSEKESKNLVMTTKEASSEKEIQTIAEKGQAQPVMSDKVVDRRIDISSESDRPNESMQVVDSDDKLNGTSDSVASAEMTSIEIDNETAADLYSEKISQETRRFSEPILTDHVLEEMLGTDDLTIEDELGHQTESFVKGAAWLTVGSVFSRILGALYIIPWSTWLGAEYTQANTLYSAGYTPYSLFLAIATAGFPSAIAKQMAFYHSKKEYRVADKLFKNSILLMLVSGLVSGALLYLLAPSLASITSTDNPIGATMVIRSLVPALLILPLMSILRGYFQGFNDMVPSAISQIIEQIARVFYLLAATYAIMMVYRGDVTQAVVHSTFAAFIGALAALAYLVILYFKRLPMINKLKERSLDLIEIDFKESMRIMLMDSVPFILLGSGIILAQVIDTYTFKQILLPTTVMLLREISELYGAMSLDVNKLVMIVVSLAVALASSVVPLITSKFAARDIKGTSSLIEQIVEVFSFVMLPAAVGMIGVSNNLYAMFYPQGHASGPSLLITGSIMSISLGLYTVLSTILQSMNFRRLAVRFLVVGLLVKLVLQVPLVAFLHAHGAMIATTIAFAVSSVLMWIKIQREVELKTEKLYYTVFKIMIGAIIMGIVVSQWNSLLDLLMGEVGRFLTFIKVMLGVGIGIFTYGGVMALLGQLSILLGDKKKELQEKMRMF